MEFPPAFNTLEQKHSLKILINLLEEPLPKCQLASRITIGTGSVQSRIEDMVKAGLLTEDIQTVKPFKKIISLTPTGKKVALKLLEIKTILE